MTKPTVILMGSKPGSVVALRLMVQRGWDVRGVVVSRKITHPWSSGETLEECANRLCLPVYTQAELPREEVDFVISYMFRYRVKPDVIELGKRASVNFHAGPLPEYGGWAFYNLAILENATEYGCTCHHLDDGFDTGPIVEVRRFPIHTPEETACSLERKAQDEMIKLFVDFAHLAESGRPIPSLPQNPGASRYWSQEEFTAKKQIPADANAETIDRIARAFWYPPYEVAWMDIHGTRVEVIPAIAKEAVARGLHADDLDRLADGAEQRSQEYTISRTLKRAA